MFDWTDEHRQIRSAFRQFIQSQIRPHNDAMEAGEPPYDVMRKLVEMLGLATLVDGQMQKLQAREQGNEPESDEQGAMRDPYLPALLNLELSHENPGFALAFGATLGLCGRTIMGRGTLEQKKRWAVPVLKMEKVGCWAITEPGSGSDAFGMRSTARKQGDRYILNGSKTYITNAPYADVMVVYAKLVIPGEEQIKRKPQAFVVERGMKGVSTGKPLAKMGMHSSPTGEIFLEDVEVGPEHLLGGKEAAPAQGQVVDVFKGERTAVAQMCLGIIERVLEDSLAYSQERHAWGEPIGSYQLIQEKLARMMIGHTNVKNIVLKQLHTEKHGGSVSLAEASAQKLYCTKITTELCLEAIQIFGGAGYMKEYQVERFMRDAKLLQIGGGTDEIQTLHVAKDLLANGFRP